MNFDFLTPDFIHKHCVPVGIKVDRDVYPWKYLGWSDTDFMEHEMHFAHGPVIQAEQKTQLLGVVRMEEEKLLEIHKFVTDRERVMGPAPKYIQLELFDETVMPKR
jgi:hypothetical protein